jgi:hypothetical protein
VLHEFLAINVGIHDHRFLDDEFAGFRIEPGAVTGGIAVAPPPARDNSCNALLIQVDWVTGAPFLSLFGM